MIYLDYSATTPVDVRVLRDFEQACTQFIANPNSQHSLGKSALEAINEASSSICRSLGIIGREVIYTSGATESNNLAIKGVALKHQKQGKHILASPYEHPSSVACLNFLSENGFEVEILDTTQDGLVCLDELAKKLRPDTILVTICSVGSETGILQPIQKIAEIVKNRSNAILHSDMTQSIGKVGIDLKDVDLITFAAHKFYGIRGIGALIRKNSVSLEPIIHGGRSLSPLRSGTPPTALIISLAKALEYATSELDSRFKAVSEINQILVDVLLSKPNVIFNSTANSLPHILNVSFKIIKADSLQKILQEHEIYVSTQTACSNLTDYSHTIYRMYKDEVRAKSSIRISLSHLTTTQEINQLIEVLDREVFYANH